MKKHFIGFWISAFLLITFVMGTLCFLAGTQHGLVLLSQYVKKKLPGQLTIVKLEGKMLGPLRLTGVHYKSSDLQLDIPVFELDWDWSALLHGRLAIEFLKMDHPVVSIPQKNDTGPLREKTLTQVKIPWPLHFIQLHSFTLEQAVLHYGSNRLMLDGVLGTQWNIHWQAHLPDLGSFLTEGSGELDVQGRITGNRSHPFSIINIPTTTLDWQNWRFETLQAKLQLNTDASRSWSGHVQFAKIKKQTLSFEKVQFDIKGQLQPFTLRGTLHSFDLTYQDPVTFSKKNQWPFPTSVFAVDPTQRGWTLALNTDPKIKAQQLHIMVELPRSQKRFHSFTDQTGQGHIDLTFDTLDCLKFIPILADPKGSLQARLDFSGTLRSPTIRFSANLQNGQVRIPELGLDLKKINFAFETKKNEIQGFGYLQSGKGLLNFHSMTSLNRADLASQITLQGKQILISHTPEYTITASPTLHIAATTQHLQTTGDILFPQAAIHLDDQTTHLAELSDDIVFVKSTKKKTHATLPTIPFHYDNQVNLILGDAIDFSYRGLQAHVKGRLAVQQRTGHPTLATGELALTKGAYHYYGQTLPLDTDSLLRFANNPIDDPNLNITASKTVSVFPKEKAKDKDNSSSIGSTSFIADAMQNQNQAIQTTVSVHIQGHLKNPKLTLSAEPADAINSQLDMLSYLILGGPSNQLSAGSIQLLLGAATHLDNNKQSSVEQFIDMAQKKIGIDELTIGSNPIFNPRKNSLDQNTSLIIRKKFSPRLNVSYSVGLLDPISILQINYLLNKHFSLQATNSSFANGIDLIYKFEK